MSAWLSICFGTAPLAISAPPEPVHDAQIWFIFAFEQAGKKKFSEHCSQEISAFGQLVTLLEKTL
jgi:hypothetical protein